MNFPISTLTESSVQTGDTIVMILGTIAGIALLLIIITSVLSFITKKKK
jgi:hypothetical protein